MKSLGINTSDDYFAMPLSELRQRAAQRDVPAMLQLAMQYMAESDELAQQDGFDPSASPSASAKKYLQDAMAAGHNHSAAILSRIYLNENPAEAAAWNMLAERLGDRSSSAEVGAVAARLSNDQRAFATARADQLYTLAMKRFYTQ